jgi:hypothetical protein
MSQQEFFPSPQSSKRDELADVEIAPQRPISWSSKFKTGDVTKNEHPSTYEEESLPLYSYPAQDRRSTASGRTTQGEQSRMSPNTTSTSTRQRTQQSFSPDGDAMEYGYRPHRSTTTQARSLRKGRNTILRVVVLVFCLILLLKLLPFLATVFVTLLGIGLFLILLPILIVLAFVIIFGGLVLLLLSRLGFPVWRNLLGRHRWNNSWRWRW